MILSFLLPERLHYCTYNFTAPTCTSTITILEPCALNAEFQHFIPKFNKNFLTLQIPLKERIVGKSRGDTEGQTEGDFTDNSNKWAKCNVLKIGNQLKKGRVCVPCFL